MTRERKSSKGFRASAVALVSAALAVAEREATAALQRIAGARALGELDDAQAREQRLAVRTMPSCGSRIARRGARSSTRAI